MIIVSMVFIVSAIRIIMSEAKFSAVKVKTSSQQINLVQKDVYQDSASVQLIKENPNSTSTKEFLD